MVLQVSFFSFLSADIRREDSFEFLQAEQYEVLTDLTKKKGINPYSNEMFLNPVLSPSIIAEQLSKKDAVINYNVFSLSSVRCILTLYRQNYPDDPERKSEVFQLD